MHDDVKLNFPLIKGQIKVEVEGFYKGATLDILDNHIRQSHLE